MKLAKREKPFLSDMCNPCLTRNPQTVQVLFSSDPRGRVGYAIRYCPPCLRKLKRDVAAIKVPSKKHSARRK